MSLVVKLEDDLGERSEWVMLHGVIPAHDERGLPGAALYRPLGKTVFNHCRRRRFSRVGAPQDRAGTIRNARPGRSQRNGGICSRIAICI